MGELRPDRRVARLALASVAQRIAALLDGSIDTSRKVPGLDWTVGDAVAHVAAETRSFARLASGEIAPEQMWAEYAPGTEELASNERMSILNAAEIAAFDPSLISRAGELVVAAVQDFLDTTADWPTGRMFHGIEGDLELPTATSVVLTELLIHGDDLARGLGKPWVIPADDARLVLTGLTALLPGMLDAEAAADMRAGINMMFRGGPRFVIWIHDGRLEVVPKPVERVDCHVWADPVAFLLVSTGRRSQWPAVLRGQLMAFGRRPLLATRLSRLLLSP